MKLTKSKKKSIVRKKKRIVMQLRRKSMTKNQENNELTIKPFLKWAGGKYKLLSKLKKYFPQDAKRFIEPFVGAGAVALNVQYPEYIINDINADLIYVWECLKEMEEDFIDECEKLFVEKNNTEESYIKLKGEFNLITDKLRKAVLFVYLNRHGFNGLCRYNGSGEFNVPVGDKAKNGFEKPYFPRKEFEKCLSKVKQFHIKNKDFREVFKDIRKGDVVYCDPPYLPISQSANFDGYIPGGFSLKDQLDLAELANKASKNGAVVVVSNHFNWYSKQIYSEMYGGKIVKIEASRVISSKVDKRDPVEEVIAVFGE